MAIRIYRFAIFSIFVTQIFFLSATFAQKKTNQGKAKASTQTRTWIPLAKDKIHDPEGPAINILQEPAEGLKMLPPDASMVGNKVNWPMAIEKGYIKPRTSIIDPDYEMEVLDLDIIFPETREMPMVLFPHKKHTVWLDCENCHDEIFIMEKGANPVNMYEVLMGNYCGRCHGGVAFPLTECLRCHSVPRRDVSVPHRFEE